MTLYGPHDDPGCRIGMQAVGRRSHIRGKRGRVAPVLVWVNPNTGEYEDADCDCSCHEPKKKGGRK